MLLCLEVGCERIGESHVAWECTEDEVPHLDAVRRDDITERVVVFAQELWEIVEQHQQHTQRTLYTTHEFDKTKIVFCVCL